MDSDPNATLRIRWVWLMGSAIAAATLLAFVNSFQIPFLFDDIRGVQRNASLSHFSTAFAPPTNSSVAGRPIANATFALSHALSGPAAWGYHAVNVAIHLGAALLVFGVIRRTVMLATEQLRTDATLLAGCTAIVWAVHPLQTESVSYIVQRTEALVSFFYLGALYAFIRAATGRRGTLWLGVSVVACALGMASKEVMVSAPCIILLYDRTFVARSFRSALMSRRLYYSALAATWLVLALCVGTGNGRMDAGVLPNISPWSYLVTQATAIPHYLRLVFWPAGQVFDYGYKTVPLTAISAVGLVVLASAAGWIAWQILRLSNRETTTRPRSSEALAFVGCVFFAVLAPSSSIVPIPTEPMAEHRMYLPLAAVLIVAVLALRRVVGRAAYIGTLLVAVGVATATCARNDVLAAPVKLWLDVTTRRPENARAWANLAHAYADVGRWQDAIAASERQLQFDPKYTLDKDATIGRSLLELHDPAAALPHLLMALRQDPVSFELFNYVGMAFSALRKPVDAVQAYETALGLNPKSATVHANLANNLVAANRAAEAWPHYETAAALDPSDAHTQIKWGDALLRTGNPREAMAHYQKAAQLQPQSAEAYFGIGSAAAQLQLGSAAIEAFGRALELDPQNGAAHHNLAILFMTLGRPREGIAEFRAAVRLAPQSAKLHAELAMALAEGQQTVEARQEATDALRLDPELSDARKLLEAIGP